jgi:hypothetical protein
MFNGQITTRFSYNWNNKLDCKIFFTTIRIHNPQKYWVGSTHRIFLKEEDLGTAKIVQVKTIRLEEIDSFTASLDTGYNAAQTRTLFRKMYKLDSTENPLVDISLMAWVNRNLTKKEDKTEDVKKQLATMALQNP